MSEYRVQIKNSAKPDLKKLKRSNLQDRFIELTQTLRETPYAPTDHFEKLLPYSEGRYSRRINIQHRIIYTVDELNKIVNIYSAWTHYE